MSDYKTASFTGHRTIIHNDIKEKLDDALRRMIDYGIDTFITGGALGFDTLVAERVLELKKQFDIKLIIAVPCKSQSNGWSIEDKAKYNHHLECSDEVVVLSEKYYNGCMHTRNRYMIDNSDICISYLYKDSGGTKYTVNYAVKKGIKVVNLVKYTIR